MKAKCECKCLIQLEKSSLSEWFALGKTNSRAKIVWAVKFCKSLPTGRKTDQQHNGERCSSTSKAYAKAFVF